MFRLHQVVALRQRQALGEGLYEHPARHLLLGQPLAGDDQTLMTPRRFNGHQRLVEVNARNPPALLLANPGKTPQPFRPVRVQRVVQQRRATQIRRISQPHLLDIRRAAIHPCVVLMQQFNLKLRGPPVEMPDRQVDTLAAEISQRDRRTQMQGNTRMAFEKPGHAPGEPLGRKAGRHVQPDIVVVAVAQGVAGFDDLRQRRLNLRPVRLAIGGRLDLSDLPGKE